MPEWRIKMEDKITVEVIEFTDPVCTWCWGSEPTLRKLKTNYAGNLEVKYVMGGLVKDIRDFSDPGNGIGGDIEKINKQIASHWLEASERHGMPVDAEKFELFSDDYPSSYPMNIAYKAAQMEDEKLANKFMRRMREAVAVEGRKANQIEVLIELAGEVGLDVGKFIGNMNSGLAENAFEDDLYTTAAYRVTGFPAYLIKASNDKSIMLRGYNSYETFVEVIKQATEGKLVEKKVEVNEDTILDFIKEYDRVAPVEIELTFELNKEQVKEYLDNLLAEKKIRVEAYGNGHLISAKGNPLTCDPVTGVCNI